MYDKASGLVSKFIGEIYENENKNNNHETAKIWQLSKLWDLLILYQIDWVKGESRPDGTM